MQTDCLFISFCLQDQCTLLHKAAREGKVAVCKVLLEHKADVNAREKVMRVCRRERYDERAGQG